MKKKLLAMLLSATMILGIAACGSEPAGTTSESKSAAATTESTPAKEESKVEVKEDPAELRLVMYGDMGTRREEFFTGEFHERILEELNIDLAVEFLPWGAVNQEVLNRVMAGEKFMYQHIPLSQGHHEKGLCAEITQEQIQEYLPDYLKMRESKGFDFVTFDGKTIAVPIGNKVTGGNNKGITVRNDILNEVGWDYKDITSYEILLEACADVQEKYPDMRISWQADCIVMAMDEYLVGAPTDGLTGSTQIVYTLPLEDDDKVYSTYESEAYKKLCDLSYEQRQLGLLKNDDFSDPQAAANDWSVGNCLLYNGTIGNIVEPGVKANMPETADLQMIMFDDLPRFTASDFDWALSVSIAAQEDVPDYLRLINWIYASKENYEFCIYGVEGKDWERNADGSIKKLTSEMMFDDWFLQAFCYHTYDSSISEETIAIYEAWDADAKKTKTAGFKFDGSSVAAEKSQIDAVVKEYVLPIKRGYEKYDEAFPAVLEKLKAAGLDKYVEEYQRQFSEWYANKNK